MAKTKIEWTAVQAPDGTWLPGETFNPWWGCQAVSPACKNCYAETFDHRLGGDHWGPNAPFLPNRVSWVIVGSESGHPSQVRETKGEWVASLRDQCAQAGVPFFLKQLQAPNKPAGRVVSLPLFQGQRHRGQPA